MAGKVKKQISFEDQLARLETIVEAMESGSLSLDEQLTLFQEGMNLSSEIGKRLEATNARLVELTRENGSMPVDTDVQPTLLDGIGEA